MKRPTLSVTSFLPGAIGTVDYGDLEVIDLDGEAPEPKKE
jgi:hypothetical protein